jgi:hypothetical protein
LGPVFLCLIDLVWLDHKYAFRNWGWEVRVPF